MITQNDCKELTIGEIVANDFRAAEVFRNAGIDFCCGGKKSIEQVCNETNIDAATLTAALQKLELTGDRTHNFNEWNLGFLCDYIVNTHHSYVLKTLPSLVFYTQKIADVHGANHLELTEAADLFLQINKELLQHMQNEEQVLFPAIKEVAANNLSDKRSLIHSEISRMSGEHDFAGGAIDQINDITSGYKLPEDACNTYKVTFQLLKQFEDDLHNHVHLENNILFPKALKL